VAEFLRKFEQNRLQTETAVEALHDARLIEPWPLTVMIGKQQLAANGLHRVDEGALNSVSAATLLELRNTSALVLAYCQLISMHTTAVFGQMAAIQEQIARQTKPVAPPWLATDDGGTLQFN
jgi:SapC